MNKYNVYLVVLFDYDEQLESKKDKTTSALIRSFAEYCDDNYFVFQCIPRIGEEIAAEDLFKKWVENKEYEKPCSTTEAWNRMFRIVKTGCFRVTEVQHSLKTCTITCSDIEDHNFVVIE